MNDCRETAPVKDADPAVIEALSYLKDTYESLHLNSIRNTERGHWINEAFVVRLYAVLEAHHVVDSNKRIDQTIDGAVRVDLCRELRNRIAHTTAKVESARSRKLDGKLRLEFGLTAQRSLLPNRFILSKDTVLRPMYAACLDYCRGVLAKESQRAP